MAERNGRCELILQVKELIDGLCVQLGVHDTLPGAIRDDMDSGPESWILLRRRNVEQLREFEDHLRELTWREQDPPEVLHPQA